MSTDLRSALREAVSDPPPSGLDVGAVVHAGVRRTRRRTHTRIGAGGLAVLVLLGAAAVASGARRDHDPSPAEIVRLDLDRATRVRLDVLASARTTWRDAGRSSLEFDRFEGITDDGLVLRSRYTNAEGRAELGLLDPATDATDWLPTPPWRSGDVAGVDLGADRLVVVVRTGIFGYTTAVFDRATRTWETSEVGLPGATEGHVAPIAQIGPDDRLYLGSTMEGEAGPMHWWSAPLDGGEDVRPEPDLEGDGLAWGDDGSRVTADPGGRVVLRGPQGERVVGDGRPAGCPRPSSFPDAPPRVVVAGDRPVVTFYCDSGESTVAVPLTVVYGQGSLTRIDGATALAADDRHLVVVGGRGPSHPLVPSSVGRSSLYVVDLDGATVSRVGRGPHDRQVGLNAGLVLWNEPGPSDDRDVYDVVWKVGRLD